jgi:hypothetical protein
MYVDVVNIGGSGLAALANVLNTARRGLLGLTESESVAHAKTGRGVPSELLSKLNLPFWEGSHGLRNHRPSH